MGALAFLCKLLPYWLTVGDAVPNLLWLNRERPQSRCVCRERDGGPHSLLSTWDGGLIDDMPRSEGHLTGRLSRLVVKDPLLCMCLWETLMFIYRGKNHRQTPLSAVVSFPQGSVTSISPQQKLMRCPHRLDLEILVQQSQFQKKI